MMGFRVTRAPRDKLYVDYRDWTIKAESGTITAHESRSLQLSFVVNSGKRGNEWHVHLGPDQFRKLADAMIKADAKEATKAFGFALLKSAKSMSSPD